MAKEGRAPAESAAEDSNAVAKVKEVTAEATAEPAPTIRQIFSLLEKDDDASDDRWHGSPPRLLLTFSRQLFR